MALKYTFPHVNTSTISLTKKQPTTATNTNTRLFAPFISKTGPENQIVVVESYEDFKNIYGDFDYTVKGQEQILNISQWFAGGGVVLAFRMTANIDAYIKRDTQDVVLSKIAGTAIDSSSDTNNIVSLIGYATGNYTINSGDTNIKLLEVEARYPGKMYNNYTVTIALVNGNNTKITNESLVNISVVDSSNNLVEFMRNVKFGEINSKFVANSDYISDIIINDAIFTNDYKKVSFDIKLTTSYDNDYCISNTTGNILDTEVKYANLIKKSLNYALKQKLETPCDIMLDPGYSVEIKRVLIDFFSGTSEINDTKSQYHRPDMFVYLSQAYIDCGVYKKMYTLDDITSSTLKIDEEHPENISNEVEWDLSNVALNTHYFKKIDKISNSNVSKEVYYDLNYYLASLIPYNDRQHGINKALAGKARGFIGTSSDITWVNKIPTDTQKQSFSDAQINYIEKENDSYYIMLQMTQLIDTNPNKKTLTKINHKRTCQLIEKEITSIARNYLHEVNDSQNKRQLENEISTYMSKWVTNRTLSDYTINLYSSDDDYTLLDTEISVVLSLKFNNEIEIVDLTFNV